MGMNSVSSVAPPDAAGSGAGAWHGGRGGGSRRSDLMLEQFEASAGVGVERHRPQEERDGSTGSSPALGWRWGSSSDVRRER
jgi:hypothetical protein